MIGTAIDTLSNTASRRDSLLALGGAGLATALADAFRVEAEAKSGKRRKKKCKNPCQAQAGQCTSALEVICELSSDPPFCKQKFLPCCDYLATCNAGAMVQCIA